MEANFFAEGSPYLEHPLLNRGRTAEEIDFILSILPAAPGDRIIDIGCGFGRHSLELARRGFDVLGIDPSPAMIAAAQEKSAPEGNPPQFRKQRGEDLAARDEFDAAICLFTTLGQVADQQDNRQLLNNTFRALRPGGFVVLEIPQRSWVVGNLKTDEQFGEGENYTLVARSFDQKNYLLREEFTLVSPAGQRKYLLKYRLFSKPEIGRQLEQAGVISTTVFDGYTDVHLREDSPVMVIRAQKAD
jgi:D-alanine-D-alanine ligase